MFYNHRSSGNGFDRKLIATTRYFKNLTLLKIKHKFKLSILIDVFIYILGCHGYLRCVLDFECGAVGFINASIKL